MSRAADARNTPAPNQPAFALAPSAPHPVRDLLGGCVLGWSQLARLPGRGVVVAGPPCAALMRLAEDRCDLAYLVVAEDGTSGLDDPRIDDVLLGAVTLGEFALRASRALARKVPARAHAHAHAGGVRPFLDDRELVWNGSRVLLTQTERRIMASLIEARGAPRSRTELTRLAASVGRPCSHTVDSHVYRLRRKLAAMPGLSIETLRQRGFRLAVAEDRHPQASTTVCVTHVAAVREVVQPLGAWGVGSTDAVPHARTSDRRRER